MTFLNNVLATIFVAATCFAWSASGEIINYRVEVTPAGPVTPGTAVNWSLYTFVTGSTNSNFGIASLDINLNDSTGDALTAGTVGAPFTDYAIPFGFNSGGTEVGGGLTGIGASLFSQNSAAEQIDNINGGIVTGGGSQLQEILLASGIYTATTPGLHTLTPSAGTSLSRYFTAASQPLGLASTYSSQNFISDSFTVTAVPEPSSLVFLIGAAGVFGALRCRRGRRRSV